MSIMQKIIKNAEELNSLIKYLDKIFFFAQLKILITPEFYISLINELKLCKFS